ncbi:hypothetical protein BH23CHL5_BH23CHL5_13210 [soil metagenome]
MTKDNPDQGKRSRISRRTLVGGTAAAAAMLGTASLGQAAPTTQNRTFSRLQSDGPSIIIGTLGEAQTINPFLTNESEGDWRCKMLFDEFVRANALTYAPEPGLAESWTVEDLTFTFTIRENSTFSDGSDVTAADVAFTIKGHIATDTASPRQVKFLSIAGAQEYADGSAEDVSGIEAVDAKTLRISLAQPDAPFLYNMRYIFVVPAAALEGKSLTDDEFFQAPVGAGPYVFES